MEFIALPVQEGDSFILKDNIYNYVVDGGVSENLITSMVKGEIGEQNIEVLVCTHYDSDHINGVIGLIKSGIKITEIWLPSIIAKVLKSNDIFSDFFEEEEFEDEEELDEELEISTRKLVRTISMRKQYKKVIYDILPKLFELITALLLIKDKTTIRWFKYCHYITKTKIKNYPLIGLNCKEVRKVFSYKSHDELVLDLTLINRMGLVFKYETEDNPNVLFTSDSNFAFLSRAATISLKENSIVTAPHHGSKNNEKVYNKITGEDLIYVRSDRRNNKRPCQNYINLRIKYCTICNCTSKHVKVGLVYQHGKWKSTSSQCTCN